MKHGRIAVKFVHALLTQNDKKRLKKEGHIHLSNVSYLLDVPYELDDNPSHIFDLFCPIKNPNDTIIFDIHGGVYYYGAKTNNAYHNALFAQQGFAVVGVDFTLTNFKQNTNLFNSIKDIVSCINHCYKNRKKLALSFEHVVLKGDSSGGQLAILIAQIINSKDLQKEFDVEVSPKIKISALLLSSPVYDFKNAYRLGKEMLTKKAIPYIFSKTIKEVGYLSKLNPKKYIANGCTPPTFVSSCKNDFINNHAIMLNKDLDKYNIKHEFIFDESDDKRINHIFNIAFPESEQGRHVNSFMMEFLLSMFYK